MTRNGAPEFPRKYLDRTRACTDKRELGEQRGADVGFRANTGRKSAHLGTSACSQEQT